jgi:ferredoxin-NADP reductase
MTSLTLLLWILVGGLLQLTIYLGITLWRHWQEYRGLRQQASDAGIIVPADAIETETAPPGWIGFRHLRVEQRTLEDEARSICSFVLVADDDAPLPPFKPGQFLTFRLDIPNPDGTVEQVVRCYSLSDAPQADRYRVSIKRALPPCGSMHPAGRSSNYFHDHVAAGTLLNVRAPSGHFYLDEGDSPVVLIGSGIGITPMLSMANWCAKEQPKREVWLFYGVRNRHELIMVHQLRQLAASNPDFHLSICFSNPFPDDVLADGYDHRGRIDVDLLRRVLPLKSFHFYICGPGAMMESLVPALEDWGVPDSRIHFEAFGPASVKRRPAASSPADAASAIDASPIAVTFANSGKEILWSPAAGSLLELAEANGVSVNSGCRAGSCGSCQTTISAGEVIYQQAPDFDPEPGNCLLCVCIPKTPVTLEA